MSHQSKHFLNTPESLVLDSLKGLCAVNPQLALDVPNKVVHIANHDRSKVSLVCGGGAGHEPAHASFVGEGMLTAAVCGSVFASPNASQVHRGIRLTESDKGTLIIVKNYTGDVLNFGLAKEQYAARHSAKADKVRMVIVGDDVAVGRTQGKIVGRRGLTGTVITYKIAGALAHRGASLDEVADVAEYVAAHLGTIGVGLEHCHVPGTASSKSILGPTEIEIGMGIHNEPGNTRLSPIPPLNKLVPQLLEYLMSTTDPERSFVPFKKSGNRVVLVVNNLGGTSELELGVAVHEARTALEAAGVVVERILSGTYMSSLNMAGFAITVLLLPNASDKSKFSSELLLSLLDETPNAPGWHYASHLPPTPEKVFASSSAPPKVIPGTDEKIAAVNPKAFITAIESACNALIKAEPVITRMDLIAGDGDCGLTLKAGASGVLAEIQKGTIHGNDVIQSVITISQVAEEQMGGTSGALYSIFFSALAQGLISAEHHGSVITEKHWTAAVVLALKKLYTYTRARPPSRTLVDPLAAFVDVLKSSADFKAAVKAAGDAAEATRDMEAKAGRSAYVEGDMLRKEHVADPGAWGVKCILEALIQ